MPHPANGGPGLRDFSLIRELARSHEARVLSLVDVRSDLEPLDDARMLLDGVRVEAVVAEPTWRDAARAVRESRQLRQPFVTRWYHDREVAGRLRRAVSDWAPDILQVEHSFLAGFVRDLDATATARTVLSLHNLGSLQYARIAALAHGPVERLSARAKARLMRGWEPRAAGWFDRCVTVSELERALLLAADPRLEVSVVENGVDTRALVPGPQAADPVLLFVGTIGYEPNADAVLWFARSVLPLIRARVPGAQLLVVGRDPPEAVRGLARSPEVVVTGRVPDVVPWYRQAAVSVVPLRAGGGTRLKVLESLALGVPVVSTTVGCEGLAVEDGRHVLLADSEESFAARVVELLERTERARELREAGRRLVEERYDWRALGARLEGVYRELCAG